MVSAFDALIKLSSGDPASDPIIIEDGVKLLRKHVEVLMNHRAKYIAVTPVESRDQSFISLVNQQITELIVFTTIRGVNKKGVPTNDTHTKTKGILEILSKHRASGEFMPLTRD